MTNIRLTLTTLTLLMYAVKKKSLKTIIIYTTHFFNTVGWIRNLKS